MSEKNTNFAVRTEADLKKPITDQQRTRLQTLAAMPDEAVDTENIPIASPAAWNRARRGRDLSRQRKEDVSLRIDADVIEWFRSTGEDWQTRMNKVLAEHYMAELSKPRQSRAG